jgi:uncharacterized membrane protein YhaH (DUF805 family)
MKLVGDHLRSLARFSGREKRQPFWLWVFVVVAVATISWMAVFLPVVIGAFGRMEQFARRHPDQVTRTVGPGSYSIQVHGNHPELMPDGTLLIPAISVISLVAIVLLAAAVARRLHDSGRSGWWGVIPVPFLIAGFAVISVVFSSFDQTATSDGEPGAAFFGYFALMMINNLLYFAALGLLVSFCVRQGDWGENRFGPAIDGEVVP